jgi:hypothetical protein
VPDLCRFFLNIFAPKISAAETPSPKYWYGYSKVLMDKKLAPVWMRLFHPFYTLFPEKPTNRG